MSASLEPKHKITVRGPNQRVKHFLYSRNSTVADLKREINQKLFIPIFNQRLLYGNELVNDTDLLFSHITGRRPTINVEERIKEFEYDLQIMVSSERIGQVQAEPSMSIAQLKMKIFFTLKFYPEVISYPTEDDPLEDNQRLANLDIETRQVELYVAKAMSQAKLRVEISERFSFLVDIRPDHTVGHLKTIIQNQLDFQAEDQKLYLANEELSADDNLLYDHQVWLYESIILDMGIFTPKRRLIFVGYDGSRFSKSIEAYVDETIDNIRSRAAEILQKPKTNLVLEKIVDRNVTEILVEGTRLQDYYNPSIEPLKVKLKAPINQGMAHVCIKLADKSELQLRFENYKTMLELKRQIQSKSEMPSDLSSMHLFLFDKELLNDESFSDYEIGHYVTLQLKVDGANPMLRIVSLIDNTTLDISETSDLRTVKDLKTFIMSEWNISIESQSLFCTDQDLWDFAQFSELNLPSGTEVYLDTRLSEPFHREQCYSQLD